MMRYAIVIVFLALIGLGVWYEAYVWDECLQSHSTFYCMRVLNP